jgi:hypothetical protein
VISWDDFVQHAKGWVEYSEQMHTHPEQDWLPIAFVQADASTLPGLFAHYAETGQGIGVQVDGPEQPERGHPGLILLPLPGDPSEPHIAARLKTLLAQARASRVALVMTAFMSYDPLAREQYGAIERAPSTVEAVLILAFDKHRLDIWTSAIARSESSPPMLMGWSAQPAGGETDLTSELQEALVEEAT